MKVLNLTARIRPKTMAGFWWSEPSLEGGALDFQRSDKVESDCLIMIIDNQSSHQDTEIRNGDSAIMTNQ